MLFKASCEISHVAALWLSASLHLSAVVGQYPEGAITRRMRKACHFQNCQPFFVSLSPIVQLEHGDMTFAWHDVSL